MVVCGSSFTWAIAVATGSGVRGRSKESEEGGEGVYNK